MEHCGSPTDSRVVCPELEVVILEGQLRCRYSCILSPDPPGMEHIGTQNTDYRLLVTRYTQIMCYHNGSPIEDMVLISISSKDEVWHLCNAMLFWQLSSGTSITAACAHITMINIEASS